MITGNTNKIDLSTSFFDRMITAGCLYVDKTRFIENFLNAGSTVLLITRQRRLGKSLNMDTLRCFLTNQTDYRPLFKGLYIENSPVWKLAHSAPVFSFDFKGLDAQAYRAQIVRQAVRHVHSIADAKNLEGQAKYCYDLLLNNPDIATESISLLMEIVFELTKQRSYILIDEYDKLLMDSHNTNRYDEVRIFMATLLSNTLKGNPYLEKALITGVMRVSHESMFSGLNNIKTHDIFNDGLFTDDYGLTEAEALALSQMAGFDIDEARSWYNGVKINGHAIYNTYSLVSYINDGNYGCYWGKSGTLDMIISLLTDSRRQTLSKLLNGEQVEVVIDTRISLKQLIGESTNEAFYSLLAQAGYLAIDEKKPTADTALISIPNTELMIVWKSFILSTYYPSSLIRTLFDNAHDLPVFALDMECFLTDRLSYHDLAGYKGDDTGPLQERLYHIFVLGLVSAYDDTRCHYPLSNRESGGGRYDILVERPAANYIFELKAARSEMELEQKANEALMQINASRYGRDLSESKALVKVGVAFCGKRCMVRVAN